LAFAIGGLIAPSLFGAFFGSEGQLPKDLQDFIFAALIIGGVSMHALQVRYEQLCATCHCWFCPVGR
jgi:hypothetical protein